MVHEDLPMISFTAEDRCDKCGARAYTLAEHDVAGSLMFCASHSRKHRQNLFDSGWKITDDTAGLEEIGYKIPELV